MDKLKFIKIYETFQKEYFEKLISDDKTYIDKKNYVDNSYQNVIDVNKYKEIVSRIRKYDIRNFKTSFSYLLNIYPDEGFMNLIKELNQVLIDKISLDINFQFSIFLGLINRIDFKEGIPEQLRNMRLDYKLYKFVIYKYKYITSKIGASPDAKNIWYFLMQDSDLLCFTSNNISGVILKNCSDQEIKEFLDKLKGYQDLEFDDELKEKVLKFYGDINYYKNRYFNDNN